MNIFRISFLVPDYDSGFRIIENIELEEGKRWVLAESPGNSFQIAITKAEGKDQESAIGKQVVGGVGFFIETSDFSNDHKKLSEKGSKFLENPRFEIYGTVAVFRDPFGNKWDLIQRK